MTATSPTEDVRRVDARPAFHLHRSKDRSPMPTHPDESVYRAAAEQVATLHGYHLRDAADLDRYVAEQAQDPTLRCIVNTVWSLKPDQPHAIIRTDWAAMTVDRYGGRQYGIYPSERDARAMVAADNERPTAGRVFLARRDVTEGGEGEWMTVPVTAEETQAALQDAPLAWCRLCDRWVTRENLAQHRAERHGGKS